MNIQWIVSFAWCHVMVVMVVWMQGRCAGINMEILSQNPYVTHSITLCGQDLSFGEISYWNIPARTTGSWFWQGNAGSWFWERWFMILGTLVHDSGNAGSWFWKRWFMILAMQHWFMILGMLVHDSGNTSSNPMHYMYLYIVDECPCNMHQRRNIYRYQFCIRFMNNSVRGQYENSFLPQHFHQISLHFHWFSPIHK